MRISVLAALALLSSPSASIDAFVPKQTKAFQPRSISLKSAVADVVTAPIAGMKPGTSGLRKKVEVWQGKEGDKYYVENFIQSLLDTATEKNGGSVPNT
jgi:hypothetical protein